jgi:uncharacterized protein
MRILHKESSSTKGLFYISGTDHNLAEMTYSKDGEHLLIIDHIEVTDELQSKGAGKQLVEAAVQFARENGIKILPLCPFAKSVFEKQSDLQDVLQ